jgi:hypothetical protein
VILAIGCLGLAVAILAPRNALRAEQDAMDDARRGVRGLVAAAESFRVREGEFPFGIDALITRGAWQPRAGVLVCGLASSPGDAGSEGSLYVVVGHEATTRVVGTVHPGWSGEIVELDTGSVGCAAFGG